MTSSPQTLLNSSSLPASLNLRNSLHSIHIHLAIHNNPFNQITCEWDWLIMRQQAAQRLQQALSQQTVPVTL